MITCLHSVAGRTYRRSRRCGGLDHESRRAASTRTRDALSVRLRCALVAITPSADAAPPCDAPPNEIVAENCLPGSPPSVWDVSGAGDPNIQGFATEISVNPARPSLQGRHRRDQLHDRRLPARVLRRRRRTPHRDGQRRAPRFPRRSRPASTDATTGLDRLRQLGGVGVVGGARRTRSRASTSPSCAGPTHDRREPHHLHRPRRRRALGPAVPDLGHDLAGVQQLRRQQPVHRVARRPRVQGELQPAVQHARSGTRRGLRLQRRVSDDPLARGERLRRRRTSAGVDTDRVRRPAAQHNVFLSVGHDEYWSGNQRAQRRSARDAGVNLAFFSGNEVFWKTRWEPSIDGTSHRTARSSRTRRPTPTPRSTRAASWTGTWRDLPVQPARRRRPARERAHRNDLHGQLLHVRDRGSGRGRATALLAQHPVATLRRVDDTLAAGTLGYEWDEDLDNGSRPAGLIRPSSTTVERARDASRTTDPPTAPGTATHTLTLYRQGSALVFGAGTVQWSWGLDGTHDRGGSHAESGDATGDREPVRRHGRAARQRCRPAWRRDTLERHDCADVDNRPRPPAATVPAGSAVTVTGTAADTGGGVGGIEVSTDDGATWHPADGRASWSYTFTPNAPGPLTLRSRATDDSANTGAASAPVDIAVTPRRARAHCGTTRRRPTSADENDGRPIEVGTKFTPTPTARSPRCGSTRARPTPALTSGTCGRRRHAAGDADLHRRDRFGLAAGRADTPVP